jgi:hypothetical protein
VRKICLRSLYVTSVKDAEKSTASVSVMHACALFRSPILQSYIFSNDASRPILDLISYEQYIQTVSRKMSPFYSTLHFTLPNQNIVAWTECMRMARSSASSSRQFSKVPFSLPGRILQKIYAGVRAYGTNELRQSELGAACSVHMSRNG